MPWTSVINDLNREEIAGTFYEKELPETNQNQFRIEKVIKKGDDLYFKRKRCNSSFNERQYKWVNIFLNQYPQEQM